MEARYGTQYHIASTAIYDFHQALKADGLSEVVVRATRLMEKNTSWNVIEAKMLGHF